MNMYTFIRRFTQRGERVPLKVQRSLMHQLSSAMAHVHGMGICHRDIKPHNILVDSRTRTLKVCDFGSAKRLTPRAPSVAKIGARWYRAPECLLGCKYYDTSIDMW